MAIAIVASFIIALLSGMGIGGGGLFAVFLTLLTDVPQLSIQGFNLLFFVFSASASVALQLFRASPPMRAVALMVATGLVGALIGASLAVILPEVLLRRAFGIMLISTGITSLRSSAKRKYSKNRSTDNSPSSPSATQSDSENGEK